MSVDWPWLLRYKEKITPAVQLGCLAWVFLTVGAYGLYSINSARPTPLPDAVNNPPKSPGDVRPPHASDSPELQTDLDRANRQLSILTQENRELASQLEREGEVNRRNSITESQLAVTKAKTAALAAQAKTAAFDLGKIKQFQTDWAALEASLLKGEAGRRIVASPEQLQLVVDIWQRERPSADTIAGWETELNALTQPITQVTPDQATISITDEHAKMLTDLGQKLKTQATEFERQKLLLESIRRETSATKPADLTLAEAIEQYRGQQEKAEADRLAAVRAAARSQAEKESAERIAASERERVEAVTKLKEQEIEAEKQRLADEAKQVEDDRKWAKLEREMQSDMNEIKGLLLAYTAPGFTYRPDNTKGPVSYSLIKSSGGLEPTHKGLSSLFFIAVGNSDRDRGGLPRGVGGMIAQETPIAPIERAQELLRKYGELMVRKGMLAP